MSEQDKQRGRGTPLTAIDNMVVFHLFPFGTRTFLINRVGLVPVVVGDYPEFDISASQHSYTTGET